MAINIHHVYTTQVDITFYSEEGVTLHCKDCGQMDDLTEQVEEVLVKHNFSYAYITSASTGEILVEIERT